jgi:branched-chain amino acid transport system permease protein
LGFEALALQLLNGLSHATTLFLMASGLTLIFGVTRIVNFAHGSFFMLGALWSAHAVTNWWPAMADTAWGYGAVILMGACVAALLGAVTEVLLLKRMRHAPQLYQLVATFGLTLALHDAMRWFFGPEEVFAPRFPGLKGAIQLGESYFPTWQLFTLALGPLVWLGLHLLLTRTLWGQRVKAATQDREMLAALGVNPAPLMLGVVMLGCGLAGLAGALQLPREPAHLQMDVNVVVETFVVVVTGGLGSIGGAFVAAVLIGVIHALGPELFPASDFGAGVFDHGRGAGLAAAGLAGSAVHAEQRESVPVFALWPVAAWGRALFVAVFVGLTLLAWGQGDYGRSLAEDVMVMMLFGLSLQWMMALGGLVSFGHAAFFALGRLWRGAVAPALGRGFASALAAGMALALAVAVAFGALVVRSSGVYLAMLSLALAQMIWAGATQWVDLTGGDNGLIGLRLIAPSRVRCGTRRWVSSCFWLWRAWPAWPARAEARLCKLCAMRRCGQRPAVCRCRLCATRCLWAAPPWQVWLGACGPHSKARCFRRWLRWPCRWTLCWSSCWAGCTSCGARPWAVRSWCGAGPSWGRAWIIGAGFWAW